MSVQLPGNNYGVCVLNADTLLLNRWNSVALFSVKHQEIEWTTPTTLDTQSIAVTQDGRIFALGMIGGIIEVWDARERQLITTLEADIPHVNGLAFSPDSQALAIVGDEPGLILFASGDFKPGL